MKSIITSLAGGLIDKVRPDLISDNQAQECTNLRVDDLGTLIPVNGVEDINDTLKTFDYLWLWRLYKKPVVYDTVSSSFEESPYNYVYIGYNSTTGRISLIGFINQGGSIIPTVNFKTGETSHGSFYIPVAQKPSLALTNIRCTVVDGVEGNNARYIEFDEDGIVVANETGVLSPVPLLVQDGQEETSTASAGIGDIRGSFYGYCYTFVDNFGVESNPSPISYNTSKFVGTDNQQIYRGDFDSAESFVKGVNLLTQNIVDEHGDYLEGIEKINLYRISLLYTESVVESRTFKYVGSINVGSGVSDYNADNPAGEIVSYENDGRVKGEDLVSVGNMIMVSGTSNPQSFPLGYPKYIKIKITNNNSRNYINGVFIITLSSSNLPTDFPTLPTTSLDGELYLYRFFMNDFVTPIPASYSITTGGDLLYILRIPTVTPNSLTNIYLAYYPTGSSNPISSSLWNLRSMGKVVQYGSDYVNTSLDSINESFLKRNVVKNEKDRLVLGGNLVDNGYSFGSCDITDVEFSTGITTRTVWNIADFTGGLHFYDMDESKVVTKEGYIDSSEQTLYTAYGFFSLDFDNMVVYDQGNDDLNKYLLFGDIYSEHRGFGVYTFRTSTGITFFATDVDTTGTGSDVLSQYAFTEGGSNPAFTHSSGNFYCFVSISVDRGLGKLYYYINNFNGQVCSGETSLDNNFNNGIGRDQFILGSSNNLRRIKSIGALSYSSDGAIKYLTDFHYNEGIYLNDDKIIENVKNGFPLYDVSPIGVIDYTTPVNNNIVIGDAKLITETPSAGTIRWSDPQGLTFPTLNELVVGREITKIVPRLGSKDSYESVIDVFTETGVYILSIDKLSSSTQLIPLTGESNSYILQNKNSLITVDNANYFISNNVLYRQIGESFTDLSSGKVSISCDSITYFPEYEGIGMLKTGSSVVLIYDIKKDIYYKKTIIGLEGAGELDAEGNRLILTSSSIKKLSSSTVTDAIKVKSKKFYLGMASLIRFKIEFEDKETGNYFRVNSIFEGTNRPKIFTEVETPGAITLDIDTNKWYYFPNGMICEFFELEFYNYTGIKKIEIEYKPRGRR